MQLKHHMAEIWHDIKCYSMKP